MKLHHESKKDLIADGALSCFLESGYNGTSVNEIARVSGVSKGGIYCYFKSKEEIFLYIFGRWNTELLKEFTVLIEKAGSAAGKITMCGEYYLEKIDSPISALVAEFFLKVKDQEFVKLDAYTVSYNSLKGIIESGVETGEFKPVQAEAATCALIALFDGIGLQWLVFKDKRLLKQTLMTALDIFLTGLCNNQS